MDKLLIRGGRPLRGEVTISGAKNAALPEMCATLLTDEPVKLTNVPRLQDVRTMRKLLDNMGVQTETHGERGGMSFEAREPLNPQAPYELVKTMRASVLALGPLLARCAKARVSCPEAVPSGRARWSSTSRDWRPWGRLLTCSMAISKPACRRGRNGSRVLASRPT